MEICFLLKKASSITVVIWLLTLGVTYAQNTITGSIEKKLVLQDFTTRRTGVPVYKISAENSVAKIPVRWAYPAEEDTDNKQNYRVALTAQFGSEVDDRDQTMWLLK